MKAAELRNLSKAELQKKEMELREDLFRLKFKLSTADLEDTSKVGKVKRDIARIKTILKEKENEG
ncbi:50S ribosomal protein L29 [Calditerrivibrio nitroreducens]|uniref:Large ribosomal subunit protein uL29 n=1 Tax=Calditerrivibrio nitroreducens (strain DSM 19672 / NBRC 101217 / Yu37-1) TaxID=768670 RepID=E4TEQ0_CALNY|nr:50S ribosomal protein L29 [Calditerrivibrio nitroreducens]ADR19407.1 ribosomal protein L29 [Calditerrivibrio nitroreducens DSM 19672]